MDVAQIKRWLIEEIRRHPGEVHLLFQGSRVMLQAEALERRSGAGKAEEVRANMEALLEGLGEQFLPGGKGD